MGSRLQSKNLKENASVTEKGKVLWYWYVKEIETEKNKTEKFYICLECGHQK